MSDGRQRFSASHVLLSHLDCDVGDSYHKYKDDVALLKQLNAKAYRFSISWSRVIPLGGRQDAINQAGLQYYVNLVDELLANGIAPMVTLFHWDLPQGLEDRYGGFLNKDEFVQDYVHFAKLMFDVLGSKVKYWITFNEPWCSSVLGYSVGQFAPGRTSDRTKSSVGDGSTEPWIAAHSILVAHGAAVKAYRDEFKARDGGMIGITLNGDWAEPWDPSDAEDVKAAQRRLEFFVGWYGDPIYHGDYPASMREQLGERLPVFSEAERAIVQGSNDFYGMNHYTTNYVKHKSTPTEPNDFVGNLDTLFEDVNGHVIGPATQSPWLYSYSTGFRKLINWISDRYGRPIIYVTENGTSVKGENDLPKEKILEDDFRVEYFRTYITALAEAVSLDKVDCRGYMAWSLMEYVCRAPLTPHAILTARLAILNGPTDTRRDSGLPTLTMPVARRDIRRNRRRRWLSSSARFVTVRLAKVQIENAGACHIITDGVGNIHDAMQRGRRSRYLQWSDRNVGWSKSAPGRCLLIVRSFCGCGKIKVLTSVRK